MGYVYLGKPPSRWQRLKDTIAQDLRSLANRLDGCHSIDYSLSGPDACLVTDEARRRIESAALRLLVDSLFEEMRSQKIERVLEQHYRGRK